MNSGRIALGFIIIAIIAMGFLFSVAKMPSSYAVTSVINATTAQVIVNGLVSTTLFGVPIFFSGMDPGATNQAANTTGGFPMIVQIDGTTNTDVNVYINGTNFAGAGSFNVGNMSYNVTANNSGGGNATCVGVGGCKYSTLWGWAFNETARSGTARNSTIHHWMSIPAVQLPGTYTNNVAVCTRQLGSGTC